MRGLDVLTIGAARRLLAAREISSVELTKAILARLAEVEPKVGACVTITEDFALLQAMAADERFKNGTACPLTGIPALLKDNLCTRGIRTTCSSKMLETYVPPYDATVVALLKNQGAVIVGKTNMDEFAMGSSNENSAFHPTRNPWDLERVPGGSSGGSAAAVAAGEAVYAIGSDTGGSVRQPAGFCSVVGLKPTYGRVSRYGLVSFASSLDQIGPLTRDVTDCALVMNAIAGHDPNDSTSISNPAPDYVRSIGADVKGLRIGIPEEYFPPGMQPEVREAVAAGIKKLCDLGMIAEEMSLPNAKYGLAAFYIIAPSEASANLARYDGVKYGFFFQDTGNIWQAIEKTRQMGFGPEVKRRIMLGTYALSSGYYNAYYLKAQQVRTLIRRDFEQAFEKYDVLVSPTSPTVPFKIGQKTDDPLQMYLSDICTLSINIAGIPAISIPAGFTDGLPIGMQIMGKPLAEDMLFRVAYAFEQATGWHKQRPALFP